MAAALWSVMDLSTMMLMTRFYVLWRKHAIDPPEALKQARMWSRDAENGEKAAYFKEFLPFLTYGCIPFSHSFQGLYSY